MATEDEGKQNLPASKEEGGGWGGWGFSLSVLSDLQKAASTAAEGISKNAVEIAKSAAKGIADMQIAGASDSESAKEEEDSEPRDPPSQIGEAVGNEEGDPLRKSALERLERASEDSLLGQGLKVIDNSVESFASGAWNALGSAWKEGSTLVQKLEHSAANLADSIQHGSLPVKASSLAPSILETGKSFTVKGMQVLERVGKETMELLITETGFDTKEVNPQSDVEQFEEVTFDRCFYIYGGPDQLEELEALSNHYALLFNRRKAKLLSEQKSFYDGKLRQIQQIFSLDADIEENGVDSEKGKNIVSMNDSNDAEMKILRDSSVRKAADMATGFTAALGSVSPNEIIQRTTDRLEAIHSEGVHRLSEVCCFAVSQLLMLGKSVISSANNSKTDEADGDNVNIDWPEDSVSKAKVIRCKAESMSGDAEAVSNSFVTGISDVFEAYVAAVQKSGNSEGGNDDEGGLQGQKKKQMEEKANTISGHLCADQTTAVGKIKEALQYLAYVVVFSTSIPTV